MDMGQQIWYVALSDRTMSMACYLSLQSFQMEWIWEGEQAEYHDYHRRYFYFVISDGHKKMKKLAVRNIFIMIAGTALCSIIPLYTHEQYLCNIQHACGFILLMTALVLNYKLWNKTNKENQYLGVLFVVNTTIVALYLGMYIFMFYIVLNIWRYKRHNRL